MRKISLLYLATSFAAGSSAHARIVCHDSYQVVAGQEISTPYCQDNNLAQVARGYGRRVSDAEVRNNPGLKNELCRYLGSDIRVQTACASTRSDGGRGK
jgi:hypothetical protein